MPALLACPGTVSFLHRFMLIMPLVQARTSHGSHAYMFIATVAH
jgi:hypothetical protein